MCAILLNVICSQSCHVRAYPSPEQQGSERSSVLPEITQRGTSPIIVLDWWPCDLRLLMR